MDDFTTASWDAFEALVGKVSDLPCPKCGKPMLFKEGTFRYKNGESRYYYVCYPCEMKHGSHPDGTPLGKPADVETRLLRKQCHELMAQLPYSTNEIYMLLVRRFNMPRREVHIGSFDMAMCRRVLSYLDLLLSIREQDQRH